MNFIKTKIPDVVIMQPEIFGDHRGYFLESYNKISFNEKIGNVNFLQDNESKSSRGVLRGLHFQNPPFAQAKLVRCLQGHVLDVVVDIRVGSPTFGNHVSVELTGENNTQLFIPRGFAHGFVVLSEMAIFTYKVDNIYAPDYESGIKWNDPGLSIDWQVKTEDIQLSTKDNDLKTMNDTQILFNYNSLS